MAASDLAATNGTVNSNHVRMKLENETRVQLQAIVHAVTESGTRV